MVLGGPAKLRYLANNFKIITPGTFVRCSVTGKPIPVAQLKYWSVEHQEAYFSAEVAFKRFKGQ